VIDRRGPRNALTVAAQRVVALLVRGDEQNLAAHRFHFGPSQEIDHNRAATSARIRATFSIEPVHCPYHLSKVTSMQLDDSLPSARLTYATVMFADILGFTALSESATVSRYLPKRNPDRNQGQRWKTFLRNHKDAIAAMDFIAVPTVRFRLLYVWFVLGHGRREIIHFGVAAHPTSPWFVQQLRDSPIGRPTERRPSSEAQIVGLPRVGGLHHRYEWPEAA